MLIDLGLWFSSVAGSFTLGLGLLLWDWCTLGLTFVPSGVYKIIPPFLDTFL